MTAATEARRRPGAAFGLALDCGYEVLGVAGGEPPRASVTLDLAGSVEPEGGARRVASLAGLTIDGDARGYVVAAPGHGTHRVSPSGDAVVSAPPEGVEDWRWQRLLTGQVLPLAAVLRGLEPMHAAAVCIDGSAVALTASPGGGKSTLAAALVLRGAAFLADDVLALEPAGERELVAHPGPALAGVHGQPPPALGRVLGREEGVARVEVTRHPRPAPLSAVVLLDRGAGHDELRAERIARPGPPALLGATFNTVVADRARLERHLDVSARAAATTVLRLSFPPASEPDRVAAALEHALA